jgi:hypothetical protein
MAGIALDESIEIRGKNCAPLAAVNGAGARFYFCQAMAVEVRDLHSSCWRRRPRFDSSAISSALKLFS